MIIEQPITITEPITESYIFGRGKLPSRIISKVQEGRYAIEISDNNLYEGGIIRDLYIMIVTPGSGGIKLLDCRQVQIDNVSIHPGTGMTGIRGSSGVAIYGNKLSCYNTLHQVEVLNCINGFLLDTVRSGIAQCNRNQLFGCHAQYCHVGIRNEAGCTNKFRDCTTETCNRSIYFGERSHRNRWSLIEEKCGMPVMHYLAQDNAPDWANSVLHNGWTRLEKNEKLDEEGNIVLI